MQTTPVFCWLGFSTTYLARCSFISSFIVVGLREPLRWACNSTLGRTRQNSREGDEFISSPRSPTHWVVSKQQRSRSTREEIWDQTDTAEVWGFMSAEVNSKSCCDWTRNAGLFLLAVSQLEAKQVRRACAVTTDFDWFIRLVWLLYLSVKYILCNAYLWNEAIDWLIVKSVH